MSKLQLYSRQIFIPILFLPLLLMPFLVISQSTSLDREILLRIKKQWGNQPALQSWNSTSFHCRWPGIKCSADDSVTGISLENQNIAGEIPPSVCDLKNLTTLDLGNNYLRGEFPKVLYKCRQLQKLNLSENLFVGQLPNDINSLSLNLQYLNLSYNNFTGDIPSSIGQLKGLITLDLQWNLFNGTFPSELGNLRNLEVLVLAYNAFSPMNLPTEFGKLKSIKFLWMTATNLVGHIPQSFGNLSALQHLDLVRNQLEGEIPNGLLLLKNLKFLYLFNNKLSGEIPTLIEAPNLVEIDLSSNCLTGTIPEGIASLPRLELLSLFENQFNGTLPPNIGLIPTLKKLKLWNNTLSGPLPPELGRHSRLEGFEVSDNKFIGQLPEHLCSGGALLGVVAFNNKLNGSIPKSLGQCHSLLVVRLYNNYFSGELPQGLWTLPNLSTLQLSNNQLSGQLPGRLAWNMTTIEISNNRFFGEIPPSVRYWHQLGKFEASNNLISGTIPLELTRLSGLSLLSLDGNRLSGELPSKIISWVSLNYLKLSRNKLSGSIPSSIGSLPVLNYLDLSNNQFSGQIPPELGCLKLSSLNLSSNNLIGKLPYGYDNGAFQNSFLNTSLCSVSGILDLPRCKNLRENSQNLPAKCLSLIIFLGLLALLAILYFNWFILFELQKRNHTKDMSWKLTAFQKLDFTQENIIPNLTKNNLIGCGGSGKIYKISVSGSWSIVAAKKIRNEKKKNEKEFQAEVQHLGVIRHLNIIKLLCCIWNEHTNILVYEYMENESLDKWIHKGKQRPVSLTGRSDNQVDFHWPRRLRVAVGAAKGLSYMHHDCSPPIIHRDVKSSNILLDSEFNAKIADFGLARTLAKPEGESYSTAVAGSFGYMAPEYRYSNKVSEKIDIYSFGVVLLELVTGKKPHRGDEFSGLAQWALRHYNQGHPIADAFDKEVKEDQYLDEMTIVFKLGLVCTCTVASFRPSMKEVLHVLTRCTSAEVSRGAKVESEPHIVPLPESGSYISSCRNSRKENQEDDCDMVWIL